MKKYVLIACVLFHQPVLCQSIHDQLAKAAEQLQADSQLTHAILGFCVVDTKTSRVVYEKNAAIGLAVASTQKIFTSCAAFERLGHDYRFTTTISYASPANGKAPGYFVIQPSGDPSFGSARYAGTRTDTILKRIVDAVRSHSLQHVSSTCRMLQNPFNGDKLPGGWIWEDIGNYYGAAAQGFNWMENQYDLLLRSGKQIGDSATVAAIAPAEALDSIAGNLHAAAKGSGDNTVVYLPYGDQPTSITGTLPADQQAFSVSGAITDPVFVFSKQLASSLRKGGVNATAPEHNRAEPMSLKDPVVNVIELYRHQSPPLDSLNYWFLRKSINLYGEALMKTLAYQHTGTGSTVEGVQELKTFWREHGIESSALHICDGSGLSPQNRVTASALVAALQYAQSRPWFNSFYNALPTYNEMKMKSGSINGARAFAGYHTAANGSAYTFAIIVNNYDGSALSVIRKMFRLLDQLK